MWCLKCLLSLIIQDILVNKNQTYCLELMTFPVSTSVRTKGFYLQEINMRSAFYRGAREKHVPVCLLILKLWAKWAICSFWSLQAVRSVFWQGAICPFLGRSRGGEGVQLLVIGHWLHYTPWKFDLHANNSDDKKFPSYLFSSRREDMGRIGNLAYSCSEAKPSQSGSTEH